MNKEGIFLCVSILIAVSKGRSKIAAGGQYLRQYVSLKMEQINRPKVQDILGKIFNKLSPNAVVRDLSEELSGQDFESIEDMNEAAQQIIAGRNARPDPELGNLSPNQVSKLIYLPWNDPKYPIKFNQQLKISDLKDSTFLTNATIFLQTLIELKDEDTATAKRNLNRKFVKAIFDKLILEDGLKEDILRYNKVIDEEDVFPLNPNEWNDTDKDGVGDNGDAFPYNVWASVDTDGDGYPDEIHDLDVPGEPTLEKDDFPLDPDRWEEENE